MAHLVILVILDGFGYRSDNRYNAIAQAHTPHITSLFAHYPHTFLQASGTAVGLPANAVGNSEVGHLTIGAGRVIEQPVTIINHLIATHNFYKNPLLRQQLDLLAKNNGRLHIIGLLSDSCVHGNQEHMYAFLKAAALHNIKTTYLHPILDGRDTLPKSAAHYLQDLDRLRSQLNYGTMGSVHGRFYAMDRNQNWDRTEKSYRILTQTEDRRSILWQQVLEESYAQNITDEFVIPTQLDREATICDGDGIIFCNWRSRGFL